MPSYVETVIVGGFLSEKETVAEELGGQHSSSATDPNLYFEQGKPRCMPNLLTRVVYNLYVCKYILHLPIGV
jgi:hypothetical protein